MAFRRFAVIMAGGSGERFWPLSRKNYPKQLLKLSDPDQTLLEQSVQRAAMLADPNDVLIATAPHLVEPIRASGVHVREENILAEPHKRNTAGCLVWVAANLLARIPNARETVSLAVITADHRVSPDEGFAKTMRAALTVAENQKALATIGIRPDRPETGYGYIESSGQDSQEHEGVAVHRVGNFREKPDAATAQTYLDAGTYLWNSGTFFWSLDAFLTELEAAAPELYQGTLQVAECLKNNDTAGADAAFERLPNISIDYALMEKARKVYVAEAAFDWDDVGSWDALERTLPSDAAGNVVQGEVVLHDSHRNIVVSDIEGVVVTVLGIEGLVVAVTKDAVLVLPKSRAQEVKTIVESLKANQDTRL